jgi:hypothetical protein
MRQPTDFEMQELRATESGAAASWINMTINDEILRHSMAFHSDIIARLDVMNELLIKILKIKESELWHPP